jgi:Na+/H+ antiporter NhaC
MKNKQSTYILVIILWLSLATIMVIAIKGINNLTTMLEDRNAERTLHYLEHNAVHQPQPQP